MSEVTMCARPEDADSLSCKMQKRPLSIITEQEGDTPDVMNHTRCQQTADTSSINKTSTSKDTSKSSKDAKSESKVSELKRTPKARKAKNKTSSNVSPLSPQPRVKKALTSTPKSQKSLKDRTLAIRLPDSEDEAAKYGSVLTSSDKEYKIADVLSSVLQTEMPKSSNSQTHSSEQQHCSGTHIPSSNTIQTDGVVSGDDTQTNNLPLLRPCEDYQDWTKIQDEAVHLTSLSSSIPRPQSFAALSPKTGHRHCTLTTDLSTSREVKGHTEQHIPQITITSVGGTQSLASFNISSVPDTDDITNSSTFSTNVSSSTFPANISSSKFPTNISSHNILMQSLINRTCPNLNFKRHKINEHLSKLKNTISSESLLDPELSDRRGSVLESPEDQPSTYLSDFWRLKETTEKLQLSPRRPSIMLWRQQYIEGQGFPGVRFNLNGDVSDERLTSDRKQRIDDALEWLRNELQEMRSQDQSLARQLLTIRQEIHQLKLQRSTEEHQELIEDLQSELDDRQDFSDVLDCPQPKYGNNPLKHIGVTRLNISARRFSAC